MSHRDPQPFSDAEVAGAFGFAARQANHEPWHPPTPAELEGLLPGYRIEALIGRGGMGAVYRAVQINLGREVAVKLFPAGLAERDSTLIDRFVQEAQTLAKLSHPNIVSIFDAGKSDQGHLHYVMELSDGTDVARRLANEGRFGPEEARGICLRVCDALAAAHELGIIHRDIKPANVLLNTKGVVKVADFGLARFVDRTDDGHTLTGHVVGTPDFTAPEAHTPGVELDGRADLYAVGVMLYQMLTGSVPRGAFKPASEIVHGLDPRFDTVISRAMQTRREDRYQKAATLRHDLEQLSVIEPRRKTRETTIAVPVGKLTAERVRDRAAAGSSNSDGPTTPSPSRPVPPSTGKPKARKALVTERRTRWLTALLAVILAALAGLVCLQRAGQSAVTLSYDLPFLVHRPGGTGAACIVYLDQADGGRLDRSIQAPLLDVLREAGAIAVVYDLIFDEPWPDPSVDTAFAEAIRKFRAGGGVVMLAAGREARQISGAAYERLIPPHDLLLDAADDFGIVPLVHDDRFIVRELSTGTRDEPSLAWKMAFRMGANLKESERLDPRWINYAGPPPHPARPDDAPSILSIPASSVLGGPEGVNPALFRGKIVVVGGSPGVIGPKLGEDLFSTPFHRYDRRGNLALMSGVEIQANLLLNLLNGNWLTRSSERSDLILVLAVALAAGLFLSRMRPLAGLGFTLLGTLGFLSAGILSMHYAGFWFPWTVAAFVQLPVAFVGGTMTNYYVERVRRVRLDADQKRLREAFSRYVSPKMLERLSEKGFHLDPGGDKTLAAMMFTDIESFSTVCERVGDPLHIVENLNDYFQRTTDKIFEHDGSVIKFIGDAIFAAWGVPFDDDEAVVKAVRAAWQLHLNATLRMDGEALRTRVGLHFGEVVAGNIGSTKHIDYTLIGDAVNVASRLEQLNKDLGTTILMSEDVAHLVGHEFCTRRLGQFRVKGRRDVTGVHELLGPRSNTVLPDWAELYEQALTAFEEGEKADAKRLFEETLRARIDGNDGPSTFFLEAIAKAEGREEGVVEMGER